MWADRPNLPSTRPRNALRMRDAPTGPAKVVIVAAGGTSTVTVNAATGVVTIAIRWTPPERRDARLHRVHHHQPLSWRSARKSARARCRAHVHVRGVDADRVDGRLAGRVCWPRWSSRRRWRSPKAEAHDDRRHRRAGQRRAGAVHGAARHPDGRLRLDDQRRRRWAARSAPERTARTSAGRWRRSSSPTAPMARPTPINVMMQQQAVLGACAGRRGPSAHRRQLLRAVSAGRGGGRSDDRRAASRRRRQLVQRAST